MGVFGFLSRATTWWNRETLGTQLYTWRKGVKVGEDGEGNIFFRDKDDRRRWVICLLYTSPSPRDGLLSRMPSSA